MKVREFFFPDDVYLDLTRDLWIRVETEGDAPLVRIGVTSFGVHLSGHFFMCRPKPIGTLLERDRTLAIVELNKTVVSIRSPLSGEVLSVNQTLENSPEIVERDCYGAGWLITLRASDWANDASAFAIGPDAAATVEARIAREPKRATFDEPALPPPQL